MNEHTVRETVTVFWDYENCPCPMSAKVSGLIKEIKTTIDETLGRTLSKRINLYAPMHRVHDKTRGDLIDCGVILMDVATKRKQESVDKRIIADIGLWAADLAFARELGIVALISGDSDFGYILSQLRDRSYISKILLFTGPNTKGSLTIHADFVFRLFFPLSARDNPFSLQNQELIEKRSFIRARADEEYHQSSRSGNYSKQSSDGYYGYNYGGGHAGSSKSRSHYLQQRGYSNAGHGHQSHGPQRRTHIDMVKGENVNSRSHSPSHTDRHAVSQSSNNYPKTPNLVSNSSGKPRMLGDEGLGSTGSYKKQHKLGLSNSHSTNSKSRTRRTKIKKREPKPTLVLKNASASKKNKVSSLSDPGNEEDEMDAYHTIRGGSGSHSSSHSSHSSNSSHSGSVSSSASASSSHDKSSGLRVNSAAATPAIAAITATSTLASAAAAHAANAVNAANGGNGSNSAASGSSASTGSSGSNGMQDDGLSLSSDNNASPLQLFSSIPPVPPKTQDATQVEQELKEQQKLKLKALQSRHDHDYGVKRAHEKSDDYYGIGAAGSGNSLYSYPYLMEKGANDRSAVAYSDQTRSQPGGKKNGGENSYLNYFGKDANNNDNMAGDKINKNAADIPSYMLYSMKQTGASRDGKKEQVREKSGENVQHLVPPKSAGVGEVSSAARSGINTETPTPKRINFEDEHPNSADDKGRKALSNDFFMKLIKPRHAAMSPFSAAVAAPAVPANEANLANLANLGSMGSMGSMGSIDNNNDGTAAADKAMNGRDASLLTGHRPKESSVRLELGSLGSSEPNSNDSLVSATGSSASANETENDLMLRGSQERPQDGRNGSKRGGSSGSSSSKSRRQRRGSRKHKMPREEECRLARVRTDVVEEVLKSVGKPGTKFEISKRKLMQLCKTMFAEIEGNEPGGLINSGSEEWLEESIIIALQNGKIEERNIGYCSLPDLLPTILACTKKALNYGASGRERNEGSGTFFNNREGKPMSIEVEWIMRCMKTHYSHYFYENSTRNVINILKSARGLFTVDRESLKKCIEGKYSEKDMLAVRFWVRRPKHG